MLTLLADENFNGRIVRGLFRVLPMLDLVMAQEVGLEGRPDPDVLEWAAAEGRVLLTHDTKTMVGFAYDRVAAGKPMGGVFEVSSLMPIGAAIDDLALLIEYTDAEEWIGLVRRLARG